MPHREIFKNNDLEELLFVFLQLSSAGISRSKDLIEGIAEEALDHIRNGRFPHLVTETAGFVSQEVCNLPAYTEDTRARIVGQVEGIAILLRINEEQRKRKRSYMRDDELLETL